MERNIPQKHDRSPKYDYVKQSARFWISHHRRCLSFHAEQGFETVLFSSPGKMWETVVDLVDCGYRVQ